MGSGTALALLLGGERRVLKRLRHVRGLWIGLEEVVASTWREVLGVRSVGRGADFLRLGGDSIKALQVVVVVVVVVHRIAASIT